MSGSFRGDLLNLYRTERHESDRGSPCHFFARSNEPCVDGKKDIRRVLAHERKDFVPDTYGERRDSERPKASNLSARLIASKAVHISCLHEDVFGGQRSIE